jgi:hypothetical protein
MDNFNILVNKVVHRKISDNYIYLYNKHNFTFFLSRRLSKKGKVFPVYKMLNMKNVVRLQQSVKGLSFFAHRLKRSINFQEKF